MRDKADHTSCSKYMYKNSLRVRWGKMQKFYIWQAPSSHHKYTIFKHDLQYLFLSPTKGKCGNLPLERRWIFILEYWSLCTFICSSQFVYPCESDFSETRQINGGKGGLPHGLLWRRSQIISVWWLAGTTSPNKEQNQIDDETLRMEPETERRLRNVPQETGSPLLTATNRRRKFSYTVWKLLC